MRSKRFFQVALWGALLPLSLLAGCRLYEPPTYERIAFAPNVKTRNVLIIGNSLTYYNDLPGLLQQLSAKEEFPINIDAVTLPNATLDDHWRVSAAKKHLQRGGWDFVVLQDYSTRPAKEPAASIAAYRQWGAEVARVGARPIIFENWTHERRPEDLRALRDTYESVRLTIGGDIAPIGRAWERLRSQHPDIDMFVDSKHPSVAGTYLTACVLYRTIYRKPATGLPTVIPGLKLDPKVAAILQRAADQQ